ncbi:uncharacterized protein [Miscanthus floridulus]|uniref:uncharacterized protein n=1 Tax=Miscanthus floridulus TaxID=154761 RepID=UPI00345963A3
MVHRPAVADRRAQVVDQPAAARGATGRRHQQQQEHQGSQELLLRRLLPCNKGKACRFKRSCFSEEDDAAASAMFLLACVVCAPSL